MRDKIKRNFVCVKIIKIKNIPKKEREATKVEVDLLKRLHHPNIVGYIDSFLSKNHESLCICMEYCDGVRKFSLTAFSYLTSLSLFYRAI
jgi:serine/threonine protein kinase